MIERALKLAREYSGVSATEMASRLGVSKSYISELESGKKRVHVQTLQRYADELSLPASAFLDFADALSGTADPARRKRAEKLIHILNWVASRDDESTDDSSTSNAAPNAGRS